MGECSMKNQIFLANGSIINLVDSENHEESFDWPCPDCGAQLEDAPGGGVVCPNLNCGYWFCY